MIEILITGKSITTFVGAVSKKNKSFVYLCSGTPTSRRKSDGLTDVKARRRVPLTGWLHRCRGIAVAKRLIIFLYFLFARLETLQVIRKPGQQSRALQAGSELF